MAYIVDSMRLHRFFVNQKIGSSKTISVLDSSLYNQLKNVFRFTVGGQVILLDNSGFEFHAMISDFSRGEINFAIVSKKESKNNPNREMHLFFSLLKKDNFEWVLEKGTELGISIFTPILSDRSEKKTINIERAQKILKESSEQSERSSMPILNPLIDLEDVLNQDFPRFAFHPKGDTFTIEHTQNFSPLGVFIGPEGGWTDREIFLMKKNNIKIYSLGDKVLRAETASIAVASLILLQ